MKSTQYKLIKEDSHLDYLGSFCPTLVYLVYNRELTAPAQDLYCLIMFYLFERRPIDIKELVTELQMIL